MDVIGLFQLRVIAILRSAVVIMTWPLISFLMPPM
jgi:hypothetical protein